MKEYIDRETARMAACELCDWYGSSFCVKDKCDHPIDNIQTADVVEVVRCRDCKNNYGINEPMCDFADRKLRETDFCSRGERRDGADDAADN